MRNTNQSRFRESFIRLLATDFYLHSRSISSGSGHRFAFDQERPVINCEQSRILTAVGRNNVPWDIDDIPYSKQL